MQPNNNKSQGNATNKTVVDSKYQKISQSEIESIVTGQLGLLNSKTNISQISNQEKLQLAVSLYFMDNPYTNRYSVKTIKASEIEDMLNKSSISNTGLTHESIKCVAATNPIHDEFEYDSSSKTYSNANHGGHGLENRVYAVYSKSSDFKNVSGRYSISYKYVFGLLREIGGGDVSVYGTYPNAKNNTNSIYTFKANNDEFESSVSNDDQVKYIENNYDSFEGKLSTYTYTFEKTNDKIKLISFNVK